MAIKHNKETAEDNNNTAVVNQGESSSCRLSSAPSVNAQNRRGSTPVKRGLGKNDNPGERPGRIMDAKPLT